jgi:hypothetical protein
VAEPHGTPRTGIDVHLSRYADIAVAQRTTGLVNALSAKADGPLPEISMAALDPQRQERCSPG